jgi:hypothetical protein
MAAKYELNRLKEASFYKYNKSGTKDDVYIKRYDSYIDSIIGEFAGIST